MIVARDATIVVNDAEDGVLSTVNDVAVVDVRDLTDVSVYVNHVADDGVPAATAELDLDTVTANVDTIVEAAAPGAAGNDITIEFVADGSGAGDLDETGFPAIVFHFEDGVTTVTNFETAVAASTNLAIGTAGTGANILADPGDVLAPTNLAGGTDVQGAFDLVVEKSIDGTNFALVEAIDEADFGDGDNLSYQIDLRDANGMPTAVKQVRVTLTTLEDAGSFSVTAVGEQRVGYR